MSYKGQKEESKIQAQSIAEKITELADKLDECSAQSLSEDYQDDLPRDNAVRGIDELRRGFYGSVTDRQDAQLVYVINKLNDNEQLDKHNDQIKQKERELTSTIRKKAYELLHLVKVLK